ncbi:MAG: reverse transcriptase family protein [Bacteroidota bacterium]
MLEKVKTLKELAAFLASSENELATIQPEHNYRVFEIPKPGKTEKRLIETPTGRLRCILDRLADGLQGLYQQHKTDAAYGFVRSYKTDPDKRNIFTNAKKHLGRKNLLNMDLDDFFHQVNETKVRNIFTNFNLFSFSHEAEELLVNLVNFHGRLPMGSPTSPPLSNFATIDLDNELLNWAYRSSFTYTRYVDDLSFSSNHLISHTHFDQINQILLSHQFIADPKKTKWYGKDDIKEVTGLLLADKIAIPDEFLKDFETDLARYRDVVNYAHQYPDGHVLEWIEKLKQVMHGRLAFLEMVYGTNHPVYRKLSDEFLMAGQIDDIEYSISWRYAGYDYH